MFQYLAQGHMWTGGETDRLDFLILVWLSVKVRDLATLKDM